MWVYKLYTKREITIRKILHDTWTFYLGSIKIYTARDQVTIIVVKNIKDLKEQDLKV